MITFISTVEDQGLDAGLALDTPKPKRKVGRPRKDEQGPSGENHDDAGPPAKRTRRSIGGASSPVRLSREERANERSTANKFDGVVLTSNRRLSRSSPPPPPPRRPGREGPHLNEGGESNTTADAIGAAVGLKELGGASQMDHDPEYAAHVLDSAEASAVVPETEPSSAGPTTAEKYPDGEGEFDATTEDDPNDVNVDFAGDGGV